MKKVRIVLLWTVSIAAQPQRYSDHFRTVCLDTWNVDREEQAFRIISDTDERVFRMDCLYAIWKNPNKNKRDFSVWYTKIFGFHSWLNSRQNLGKEGAQLYDTLCQHELKQRRVQLIQGLIRPIKGIFARKREEEQFSLLERSTMELATFKESL